MKLIDTHNHSLPSIDDGAKSYEMALQMLQISANEGITDVVLTPHHLNGAFNNWAEQIQHQASLLKIEAAKHHIKVNLHTASEVHLVPETLEQLLEGKALTYCGHGKAALLELPKSSIPTGAERILSELIYKGITPIIAHPERNSILRNDFGQLKEWVSFGCKSQVTGQSCTGSFGSELQKVTMDMIANGLVHVVASDAHRPRGRSPSLINSAKAVEQHFNEGIRNILFYSNPLKLLNGENLESLPVSSFQKNKNNTKTKKRSLINWLNKI